MSSYTAMKENTIIEKCLDGIVVHTYKIENEIGHGGSGFTYFAVDETGKKCVLKEYIPFSDRFLFKRNSEEKLVFCDNITDSQKNHIKNKLLKIATHEYDINHKVMITERGDNSPYIFDYSIFYEKNSDVIYGLVQTVEGQVFSNYIKTASFEDKIDKLIKIANAVDYINSRGILHADITPENIFVNSNGQVQILDFGTSIDFYKFRQSNDEEKKIFIQNLIETNVGSISNSYCSDNLIDFANSISIASIKNKKDIIRILEILNSRISYFEDAYSFKQVILYTLIGASESKIYSSSLTFDEYLNETLAFDEFRITFSNILKQLFFMNEFNLSKLKDILQLIKIYKIQYNQNESDYGISNFLVESSLLGQNAVSGLTFYCDDLKKLLKIIIELPLRIKSLFGAPYWFIKDINLEFALSLCYFPFEFHLRKDYSFENFEIKEVYINDWLKSFFNNYHIVYVFEPHNTDGEIGEIVERRQLAKKILSDLYYQFKYIFEKINSKLIPSIIINTISETLDSVIDGTNDIVCYEKPFYINEITKLYSSESKARFIFSEIIKLFDRNKIIRWPEEVTVCKNIYKLLFTNYNSEYQIIFTNDFSSEIEMEQKNNNETPFKFFFRYDENIDEVLEKTNSIFLFGDSKNISPDMSCKFPDIINTYDQALFSFTFIGVPNFDNLIKLNNYLNKLEQYEYYSIRTTILAEKDNSTMDDNDIYRLLSTLAYGGVTKDLLYNLSIFSSLSRNDIDKILKKSPDIFKINNWYYLTYSGCKSHPTKISQDVLVELLINFLSNTNTKPSYRNNLFLDGIFSALNENIITKTVKAEKDIPLFQLLIQYLRNCNCNWLISTFSKYWYKTYNDSHSIDTLITIFDIEKIHFTLSSIPVYFYNILDNTHKNVTNDFKWDNEKITPIRIFEDTAILPDNIILISSTYIYKNIELIKNMDEIVIPDSVQYITDFTFDECSNLKRINIPQYIHYISKSAFSHSNGNIEIKWQEGTSFLAYDGTLIDTKEKFLNKYILPNKCKESNIDDYLPF